MPPRTQIDSQWGTADRTGPEWVLWAQLIGLLNEHARDLDNLDGLSTTPVQENVAAYGAKGDGTTDDTVALQNAINAAATSKRPVYLPPGTYRVTQNGANAYCLTVPAGVRIRGLGPLSIIQKDATLAGTPDKSVSTMIVQGDDGVLEDFVIDGNRPGVQYDTHYEHQTGIFVQASNRLRISNVESRFHGGDGIQVYLGNTDPRIVGCYLHGNSRQGVSFTSASSAAPITGVILLGSTIRNNYLNEVDIESSGTGYTSGVVMGCTIDKGAQGNHAITFGGGKDWTVSGCNIRGVVEAALSDNLTIAGNVIEDFVEGSGAVFIYERNTNISVVGNTLRSTHAVANSVTVRIEAISQAGQLASDIVVEGNVIDCSAAPASQTGLWIKTAASVTVKGNRMVGPGVANANGYGVYARATSSTDNSRSVNIEGNTIRNFGAKGIVFAGNGVGPQILFALIANNVLDDTTGTMTVGIDLNADAANALQSFSLLNNRALGGVTTVVANVLAGSTTHVTGTTGNSGWVAK